MSVRMVTNSADAEPTFGGAAPGPLPPAPTPALAPARQVLIQFKTESGGGEKARGEVDLLPAELVWADGSSVEREREGSREEGSAGERGDGSREDPPPVLLLLVWREVQDEMKRSSRTWTTSAGRKKRLLEIWE